MSAYLNGIGLQEGMDKFFALVMTSLSLFAGQREWAQRGKPPAFGQTVTLSSLNSPLMQYIRAYRLNSLILHVFTAESSGEGVFQASKSRCFGSSPFGQSFRKALLLVQGFPGLGIPERKV